MTIFENEKISNNEKIYRKKHRENQIEPNETDFDKTYEKNIRPKYFEEYIGQSDLKNTLKISIEASKKRKVALDHLLLYGSAGLGKTTLAQIIANEMGTNITITSAPSIERPRDMIGILMSLKSGQVLFVDEIHRLNKIAQEILYPAMEDFFIDMTSGKTHSVKPLRVSIPQFTLIGATTKAGSLSGPLRDRFGIIHRLQFYNVEELIEVIRRTGKILDFELDDLSAREIALRSRGTPRIANRLVKRVIDFALVKYDGKITLDICREALDILKIDKTGLDSTDRLMLELIIDNYNGGPVGLETLSAALGEDAKTIEDIYEPYLMQCGLIQRTPRGRKATEFAYKTLNRPFQSRLI